MLNMMVSPIIGLSILDVVAYGGFDAMTTVAGIELIISSICNATSCNVDYKDNPITDIQISKKQVDYQNLKDEFVGKHLKIATYNNYPLSWTENDGNGTITGHGVAFVVVEILRKKLNFTYEVIEPLKNYEVGGDKADESLLGLVNSTKVDMAAAFLPVLSKFKDMVEFSTELDEGVWVMMLKRPQESAAGSGLLAPFENHVWYLILAAVLAYGPCISLLTRIRSSLVKDEEYQLQMSPSYWFVYGSLVKQGTTLAPEANTTRVLFATWWMFIILLSAFYTANLTAFLTLSKFTLDIEDPQDLYKKNYRWVAAEGGTVDYVVRDPEEPLNYLNKMVDNGRAEYRSFSKNSEYLPLVQGGAVLIKEETGIEHIMYSDYLKKAKAGVLEADRCTYVIAPKPFMQVLRAFAFPINSNLKALFDPVLVHIIQAGIVKFQKHKNLPSTKICPLDLQSKDRRLRNSDLIMTYMIMVVGIAAAAAVFIGEVIIKRYIRIKLKDSKVKKKRHGKRNTTNRDFSHPPPYESLFGNHPNYVSEKSEKKIVNGREYWVVDTISGDSRLIPVKTPSALLYQRTK